MYRIRILDAATRDLTKLDKPIGRRIVERIGNTNTQPSQAV